VAKLNARTDNFISLLLQVSGKARPSDIQGVDPETALASLMEYAVAHPEQGVFFDGEALVIGAAPSPVVAPAPSPEPVEAAESFEFGPADPFPTVPQVTMDQDADAIGFTPAVPAPAPVVEPGLPLPAGSLNTADFVELPPLEGVSDASTSKPKKKSPILLIVLLVVLVAVVAVVALGYIGIIPIPGLMP